MSTSTSYPSSESALPSSLVREGTREGGVELSRKNLVGKFPDLRHFSAPKAASYKMTSEARARLVSLMALV